MKYINPIYKTTDIVTSKLLIEKYDFRKCNGEVIYRFPVYKYSNKPLIYTDFVFYEDEHQINIKTVDCNGNNYNYNKEEFGDSDVIEVINKKIWYKLNEFKKEGVIIL